MKIHIYKVNDYELLMRHTDRDISFFKGDYTEFFGRSNDSKVNR